MNARSTMPLSTRAVIWPLLLAVLLCAPAAMSQESPASRESTLTGEVVTWTRNTLVVRTANGQYQLFVFDRETARTPPLPPGSSVRVVSTPGEEASVRVARQITPVTSAAKTGQRTGTQQEPVVPTEVRQLERDIERQMRRYQAGVRAGMALDPELVLLGVHSQLGPFFNPDVFFRPNVEFAFGEVTTLFAINLEGIYRLPISLRQGRWSAYVGIGPAFNFLHQNFEREAGEDRDIDFGEFDSDVALNILGGLRSRGGMFVELKTSVYARPAPTLRLILGYNF